MVRLGLIKETKSPEDNRVLLTPNQVREIHDNIQGVEIVVETSQTRAFSDQEYINNGISVVSDLSDCDILLGIKEVALDKLIPNKHYFFFGHIAKMQPYNRPLIKELMSKKITFSDYEYLIDDTGHRVCAFGWWAGFIGVYNSLRAYGFKMNLFQLPDPLMLETTGDLINQLKPIQHALPTIVVTGNGKVSEGALSFLKEINYKECAINECFLDNDLANKFIHLTLSDLVKHKNISKSFNRKEFESYPERYVSNFNRFYSKCDVFIPCHYWGINDPIYITEESLKDPNFKIKVIGDVTCDILGGIKSTIRPSTHSAPFYDIDKQTMKELQAFSSPESLTVMAVDTLPNALPRAASEYFGDKFIKNVLEELLKRGCDSRILKDATILKNGKLTPKYSYLAEYAK